MRLKQAIAEWLFGEELDDAYAMGTREGYRYGSAEAKRSYSTFIGSQVLTLLASADAKHRPGINSVLSMLMDIEKERGNNDTIPSQIEESISQA